MFADMSLDYDYLEARIGDLYHSGGRFFPAFAGGARVPAALRNELDGLRAAFDAAHEQIVLNYNGFTWERLAPHSPEADFSLRKRLSQLIDGYGEQVKAILGEAQRVVDSVGKTPFSIDELAAYASGRFGFSGSDSSSGGLFPDALRRFYSEFGVPLVDADYAVGVVSSVHAAVKCSSYGRSLLEAVRIARKERIGDVGTLLAHLSTVASADYDSYDEPYKEPVQRRGRKAGMEERKGGRR